MKYGREVRLFCLALIGLSLLNVAPEAARSSVTISTGGTDVDFLRPFVPDAPISTPAIAFDNLELLPESVAGFRGDTGDVLVQPFEIGEDSVISSVELQLHRIGNPVGDVKVELWDDDGAGNPGAMVEEIGTISEFLSLLSTKVTFEKRIEGLEKLSTYYVALSFEGAVANYQTDSIGWELVASNGEGGYADAGPGLILANSINGQAVSREWREVGAFADGTAFDDMVDYFAMRVVTTVPEPASISCVVAALLISAALSHRQQC